MKPITKEWFKSSDSDLLLIGEIIENEALTHMVAFHAQQAVEKCLKAILEEHSEIPKIHNLKTLVKFVEKVGFALDIDVHIIEQLDMLYIESRYPGEFGLLPSGKPTIEEAKVFYESAKYIYETTTKMLESGTCGTGGS